MVGPAADQALPPQQDTAIVRSEPVPSVAQESFAPFGENADLLEAARAEGLTPGAPPEISADPLLQQMTPPERNPDVSTSAQAWCERLGRDLARTVMFGRTMSQRDISRIAELSPAEIEVFKEAFARISTNKTDSVRDQLASATDRDRLLDRALQGFNLEDTTYRLLRVANSPSLSGAEQARETIEAVANLPRAQLSDLNQHYLELSAQVAYPARELADRLTVDDGSGTRVARQEKLNSEELQEVYRLLNGRAPEEMERIKQIFNDRTGLVLADVLPPLADIKTGGGDWHTDIDHRKAIEGVLEGFDPKQVAGTVHEAIEGWGSDETAGLICMQSFSREQIEAISLAYVQEHRKPLAQVLNGMGLEGEEKEALLLSMRGQDPPVRKPDQEAPLVEQLRASPAFGRAFAATVSNGYDAAIVAYALNEGVGRADLLTGTANVPGTGSGPAVDVLDRTATNLTNEELRHYGAAARSMYGQTWHLGTSVALNGLAAPAENASTAELLTSFNNMYEQHDQRYSDLQGVTDRLKEVGVLKTEEQERTHAGLAVRRLRELERRFVERFEKGLAANGITPEDLLEQGELDDRQLKYLRYIQGDPDTAPSP